MTSGTPPPSTTFQHLPHRDWKLGQGGLVQPNRDDYGLLAVIKAPIAALLLGWPVGRRWESGVLCSGFCRDGSLGLCESGFQPSTWGLLSVVVSSWAPECR